MEADDAGFEAVVLGVVLAEPLRDELLPAVGVLGLGGVGVLFLERGRRPGGLEVLRVDAGGGGVEVAGDAVLMRRLQGVDVDEGVVVEDLGVVGGDEAHAAHVGGEGVDLVDVLAWPRGRAPSGAGRR